MSANVQLSDELNGLLRAIDVFKPLALWTSTAIIASSSPSVSTNAPRLERHTGGPLDLMFAQFGIVWPFYIGSGIDGGGGGGDRQSENEGWNMRGLYISLIQKIPAVDLIFCSIPMMTIVVELCNFILSCSPNVAKAQCPPRLLFVPCSDQES